MAKMAFCCAIRATPLCSRNSCCAFARRRHLRALSAPPQKKPPPPSPGKRTRQKPSNIFSKSWRANALSPRNTLPAESNLRCRILFQIETPPPKLFSPSSLKLLGTYLSSQLNYLRATATLSPFLVPPHPRGHAHRSRRSGCHSAPLLRRHRNKIRTDARARRRRQRLQSSIHSSDAEDVRRPLGSRCRNCHRFSHPRFALRSARCIPLWSGTGRRASRRRSPQ